MVHLPDSPTLRLVPWQIGTEVPVYPRVSDQMLPDMPPTGVPIVAAGVVQADQSLQVGPLPYGDYWACAPLTPGQRDYRYLGFQVTDPGPLIPGPQGPVGPDGPVGPQGPVGPAGPTGINWRGTWSAAVAYNARDAVLYNASTYITPAGRLAGQANPAADPVNWNLMAYGEGITWRGPWSSGTVYNAGDGVSSQGSSYVCKVNGTTGAGLFPPSTPANWDVLTLGFRQRGAWSSGTAYVLGDVVSNAGGSYYRIIPGTTGTSPPNDAVNWALVASKGDQGVPGTPQTSDQCNATITGPDSQAMSNGALSALQTHGSAGQFTITGGNRITIRDAGVYVVTALTGLVTTAWHQHQLVIDGPAVPVNNSGPAYQPNNVRLQSVQSVVAFYLNAGATVGVQGCAEVGAWTGLLTIARLGG